MQRQRLQSIMYNCRRKLNFDECLNGDGTKEADGLLPQSKQELKETKKIKIISDILIKKTSNIDQTKGQDQKHDFAGASSDEFSKDSTSFDNHTNKIYVVADVHNIDKDEDLIKLEDTIIKKTEDNVNTKIKHHENIFTCDLNNEPNKNTTSLDNDIINKNENLFPDYDDFFSLTKNEIVNVPLPDNFEHEAEVEQETGKIILDISQKTREKRTGKQQRNSKRNMNTPKEELKSYIDFLSDDEILDYQGNSRSWEGSEDSDNSCKGTSTKRLKTEDSNVDENVVGERGIKRKIITKKDKREENSKRRHKGESYVTSSGNVKVQKLLKENPCVMAKKCPLKCYEICEEKRQAVFQHFNSLNFQKKRDWIAAMSLKEKPKRKRVKESTRRENTYLYFINDGEGRRQVCLRFVLATLDVSQKFVHYTLSNVSQGLAKDDARGKAVPYNKTKEEVLNNVREFLKKLPAVPSHYCRKDTSRLYLPSEMKNISNVYEKYKSSQRETEKDYIGEKLFRKIFTTEFNLSFHVPKKDKCAQCVKFKNTDNDTESIKFQEEHEKQIKETKDRFKYHQEMRLTDESSLCTSYDLQKVLNTPMGDSMLLFYSRKIGVLNLCFYESVTKVAYCYTWNETEGKRGGNEVATIMVKYIKEVDKRAVTKNLILYSDSCPGQNKNKITIAAVHYALSTCQNIKIIQLNYLIPGHTNMPVDSVHAVIESSTKGMHIWGLSQWPTIFEMARKSPFPYKVEILTHDDFLDYATLAEKYFKGNLKGKINNIKIVTLRKNTLHKIFIKYSMNTNAITEEVEVIKRKVPVPKKIYSGRIPIAKKKFEDLKTLCDKGIIPKAYKSEYLELPYDGKITDALLESDAEDTDSNSQEQ